MTERRADEATRNVADWLKCDFMQDHVGETFTGIISSVTGFGFFVRLDDLFIDGLVHVSALDNDYYRFDNVGQRLIGESSGQTYRLGDKVEIRVDAVHMDERKIDFVLLSSTRTPRGAGKTEKDRAKRTLREDKAPSRGSRRGGKMPANFEPDSAFRKDKDGKPARAGKAGTGKKDKSVKIDKSGKPAKPAKNAKDKDLTSTKPKAKKVSAKTKKIAAATKAKRAGKKAAE